jgi:hypothetical protein
MLRSLIHFELILVQGQRLGSSFNLLQVEIQVSQHHLLKRLSFLQHTFWAPLSKIKWLSLCGFVSGSSNPLVFMSVLCQYHVVFITGTLEYSLKSDIVIAPAVLFWLRIALAI